MHPPIKLTSKLKNPNYYLYIILLLALVILLWHRGSNDAYEWDEGRNGVNAYHMFFNHDYINFYYGNKVDTLSSKPPLLIWLITLSYSIFGFNEFALRFPTLIATLIFFVYAYKLVSLYTSHLKAFLTCLILLSCRAIIGRHIGLTGDFDALLILFLTTALYYYSKFLLSKTAVYVYLTGLMLGLAFYTKGPASFLYLPGMLLFTIIQGKFKQVFSDLNTYGSILFFVLIMLSWFYLATTYSAYGTDTHFNDSNNSVETLFIHETFRRITDNNFSNYKTATPLFFFNTLEVRMNIWHLLFYGGVLFYIIAAFKKDKVKSTIDNSDRTFLILSACIAIPIILVVNFAANTLDWYFTPAWLFIAFFIVHCVYSIGKSNRIVFWLFGVVFVFNYFYHIYLIDNRTQELHYALSAKTSELKHEEHIVLFGAPKENLLLYINWLGLDFTRYDLTNEHDDLVNEKGIMPNSLYSQYMNKVTVLKEFDEYKLVTIKD